MKNHGEATFQNVDILKEIIGKHCNDMIKQDYHNKDMRTRETKKSQ